MIIKTIRVANLRGILGAVLHCDSLTALVGGNGCGKSTFLKAIELFYTPLPRLTPFDFYNDDPLHPIEIAITFTGLSNRARERFAQYVHNDELLVTRELTLVDGKQTSKYHGVRLQVPEFAAVRRQPTKTAIRAGYDNLQIQTEFDTLPTVRSADQAIEELAKFELAHPERCDSIRDEGSFFGFAGSPGNLAPFTRFLLIPAVRDASVDIVEGRGSPITELLDLNVRGALSNREDVRRLRAEINVQLKQLMNPDNLIELRQLQQGLSETLQSYIPDAGIEIYWGETAEIELPMPQGKVKLKEHGYPTEVTNAGHGLQRTLVLTMLQELASTKAMQATAPDAESSIGSEIELPDLVLAVEEPELYQHPNRQRHFAKLLYGLANNTIPGVSHRTQVIYTTHSPHFAGIDRFEHVRVCQKVDGMKDMPKVTRVTRVTGDDVARALGKTKLGARGTQDFSWESVRAQIHRFMTPLMNEGFFAEVVVLVEGDEDRAALLGVSAAMGIDLDAHGISVISCGGKTSINHPYVIFREFGIKTYVVWDGDYANPHEVTHNRDLLALLGSEHTGFTATYIGESFTCFKETVREALHEDLGELVFEEIIGGCISSLHLQQRDQSKKNPLVMMSCIEEAYRRNLPCKTIESIVNQIMAAKAA